MKRVHVAMYSALLLLFCSARSQAQQNLASTRNSDSNAGGQAVSEATGKGTTDYVPLWLSALQLNTTGSFNTASGAGALFSNTTGVQNTATGEEALGNNTTGSLNTATGAFALAANTAGYYDTAEGWSALSLNTTGCLAEREGFEPSIQVLARITV